jgi:hypothetical protein
MEESEGPDSPDVANLLNDLADMDMERQDFPAALGLAERSQAVISHLGDRFSGEDAVRVRLRTLELLGTIRRTLGDNALAEVDLQQLPSLVMLPRRRPGRGTISVSFTSIGAASTKG